MENPKTNEKRTCGRRRHVVRNGLESMILHLLTSLALVSWENEGIFKREEENFQLYRFNNLKSAIPRISPENMIKFAIYGI